MKGTWRSDGLLPTHRYLPLPSPSPTVTNRYTLRWTLSGRACTAQAIYDPECTKSGVYWSWNGNAKQLALTASKVRHLRRFCTL